MAKIVKHWSDQLQLDVNNGGFMQQKWRKGYFLLGEYMAITTPKKARDCVLIVDAAITKASNKKAP